MKQSTLVGAPVAIAEWLEAPPLGRLIQHEARQHTAIDLATSLFAAPFANEFGLSPKLNLLSWALLPEHETIG